MAQHEAREGSGAWTPGSEYGSGNGDGNGDGSADGRGDAGGTSVPQEDPRRVLGRRGEQLAADHLEAMGLVVLSRNWRCREGELDIVATDGIDRLYFCEVKTRSGEGFGSPAEAVTMGKRRKIRRLATIWLSEHRLGSWKATQFDVISVLWPPQGEPVLRHLADAF